MSATSSGLDAASGALDVVLGRLFNPSAANMMTDQNDKSNEVQKKSPGITSAISSKKLNVKPSQQLNDRQAAKGVQKNRMVSAENTKAAEQVLKNSFDVARQGQNAKADGAAELEGQSSLGKSLLANSVIDAGVTGALAMVNPMLGAAYAGVALAQDAGQIARAMGQGSQVTHNQGASTATVYGGKGITKRQMEDRIDEAKSSAQSSVSAAFSKSMSKGPGFGPSPKSAEELCAQCDYARETLADIRLPVKETPEVKDALRLLEHERVSCGMDMKRQDKGIVPESNAELALDAGAIEKSANGGWHVNGFNA